MTDEDTTTASLKPSLPAPLPLAYMAGFDDAKIAALKILGPHLNCDCRGPGRPDSRMAGQEHWGNCLVRIHGAILSIPYPELAE